MITLRFGLEDPLRCRFAISPVWETVNAYEATLRPDRNAVHVPWLRQARERLAGADLGPLPVLLARQLQYVPDFLSPPPRGPVTTLHEEIERIRTTPPDLAAREIAWAVGDEPAQEAARALLADPAGTVQAAADALVTCWQRLLEPDWSQVRDLLEADIVHRAAELTAGGVARMLDGLHERVSWRNSAVRVRTPLVQTVDLAGRGLLFMPSAFVWPRVLAVIDPPWQPTLLYPARGIAALWQRPAATPEALGALVGRTRATILGALEQPATTTQLAARLGLSPGTVSEHLGVLRSAGAVVPRRAGRTVRYALTPLGSALLAAGRAPSMRR